MSTSSSAPTQIVTPELRDWIVAQTAAGHSPEIVIEAMQASGWRNRSPGWRWSPPSARTSRRLPRRPPGRCPAGTSTSAAASAAGDRDVAVLMAMSHPRVVVFGDLLSDEECDELIELAGTAGALRDGRDPDRRERGQRSAHQRRHVLPPAEFPSAPGSRPGSPACSTGRWRTAKGCRSCAIPGAEYKPHYDYFDPAEPGTPAILKRGGQRLGLDRCYLNTPETGGATVFPEAGIEVAPVSGNAVFFSYDRPHPSTRTLHGGAPVTAGEKWVATKWMREGRFE